MDPSETVQPLAYVGAVTEAEAMQRALEAAAAWRGHVEPNPLVGCVLLRGADEGEGEGEGEGEVVAVGAHQRFGGPHAEAVALEQARGAGHDVQGTTAVVTLEPCCHTGKTGPCTGALIAAGVARVVVAMLDPDPRVAGGGVAALREAGVQVSLLKPQAPAARAAAELNAPFVKRVLRGLPYVTLKWAQTIDGRTATRTGDSRWISSGMSRLEVHRLRSRSDAVLVGRGTVEADDPALTVRLPADEPVPRIPVRLVASRTGRLPETASMLHDGGPEVRVLAGDLAQELSSLAASGMTHVMCEGGAGLAGALLTHPAGLVDELHLFLGPKLVLDDAAPGAIKAPGPGILQMADAVPWTLIGADRLGDDVRLRYRVARQELDPSDPDQCEASALGPTG